MKCPKIARSSIPAILGANEMPKILYRWRKLPRIEAFLLPAVFGYKASADVSTGQVKPPAAN